MLNYLMASLALQNVIIFAGVLFKKTTDNDSQVADIIGVLFISCFSSRKFFYIILTLLQGYEWLSYVHMIDSEKGAEDASNAFSRKIKVQQRELFNKQEIKIQKVYTISGVVFTII